MKKLIKIIRRKKKVMAKVVSTEAIAPVVTTETKTETKPTLNSLCFVQDVLLGGDPEFFFAKDGEIIGSEKVLTNDGIHIKNTDNMHRYHPEDVVDSQFVIDGVQAELHPRPATCRALLGNEIASCFRNLSKMMQEKGVTADFSQCVEVSQKEMDTLSEKNKVFGCAPSLNAYEGGESKITVDPKVYRGRAAGGHIHIGNSYSMYLTNPEYREQFRAAYELNKDFNNPWMTANRLDKALKTSEIIVPVLDIVLGNTCVLIDRNPANVERRKVYGKAGEHRIKDYGIEYRVLSNFWLRSYQLMSFVTGLCRFAVHLVEQSKPENDYVKALFDAVSRDDIIKAINGNDFDLALKNFKAIIPIISEAAGKHTGSYPLTKDYIQSFLYFVHKGVDHWFDADVIKNWVTSPEGHGSGWEAFLMGTVFKKFRNSLEKTPFNLKSPAHPTAWDGKASAQYTEDWIKYNKAYKAAMDPTRYVCLEVKDPSVKQLPIVATEPEIVTV